MVSFFKSFGRGVLYVLVLPLLLVVLAGYAVVSFVIFIILGIKFLILFFTGRSLFDDLPEDKQAKAILNANAPKQENVTTNFNSVPTSENIAFAPQPNIQAEQYYGQEDARDPFYVPEYLKAPVEEKDAEMIKEEQPVEENNYEENELEEEKEFEYSSDFDDMRKEDEPPHEEVDISFDTLNLGEEDNRHE